MTLVWRIELDEGAKKDLAKLDRQVARRILAYLRERIATADDPRRLGEALRGPKLGEFWKYRVGAYRVIAHIEDNLLRILVVRIASRGTIYKA